MKNTQVARLLAYVTGMVSQELLLQNEYLVAENRILRAHLPTRLRLTDPAGTMSIAGHLDRKMLEHYSQIRNAVKRKAVDAIKSYIPGETAAAAGECTVSQNGPRVYIRVYIGLSD